MELQKKPIEPQKKSASSNNILLTDNDVIIKYGVLKCIFYKVVINEVNYIIKISSYIRRYENECNIYEELKNENNIMKIIKCGKSNIMQSSITSFWEITADINNSTYTFTINSDSNKYLPYIIYNSLFKDVQINTENHIIDVDCDNYSYMNYLKDNRNQIFFNISQFETEMVTLNDYVSINNVNYNTMYNFFINIYKRLNELYDKYMFIHWDLHMGNIFVKEQNGNIDFKLFDFDLSSTKKNYMEYVCSLFGSNELLKKYKTLIIDNRNRIGKYYDILTLLLMYFNYNKDNVDNVFGNHANDELILLLNLCIDANKPINDEYLENIEKLNKQIGKIKNKYRNVIDKLPKNEEYIIENKLRFLDTEKNSLHTTMLLRTKQNIISIIIDNKPINIIAKKCTIFGGNNNYYDKYTKYKQKYTHLKNHMLS